MKSGEKNAGKELYQQLRAMSWNRLWNEEAPQFDRASPKERIDRVALVRAVGVVFSESGDQRQKEAVRQWLLNLLRDPAEKIRRYAMAAMPKIGAGPREEAELLSLLQKTTADREKKFLGSALNKIGGAATLEVVTKEQPSFLRQTEQKVRASVARSEEPSAIRLNADLLEAKGLRIHLRGRRGLEQIVREEAAQRISAQGKFCVEGVSSGLVVLVATEAFSLADIYAMRCFGSVGLCLGEVSSVGGRLDVDALASLITSDRSLRILRAFTEGSIRYRLDFVSRGHQRGAVRRVAELAYQACPEILNDSRNAPWSIDIYETERGCAVELRPRLTPDPRFLYRQRDVPAASHPPLAACMARLAGVVRNEVVWDPFCGSGLELVERDLLGGVSRIFGTDRSAEAVETALANLAAAKIETGKARIVCADFRDHASIQGLGSASTTLIVTNPPMGKRVPVGDLRRMIQDLFSVAAAVLETGGRLVFVNPVSMDSPHPALELQSRRLVDLGGFDCRLEKYVKVAR